MNLKMAKLADKIAEKIKAKINSPMPLMAFHCEAYPAIMAGPDEVRKYLTQKEMDDTGYYNND